MILAVDVHYQKDKAVVAGITFQNWQDRSPENEYVLQVENITAYVPGYFFRRELPCILKIISEYNLQPEIIVIDGYVCLDGHTKPGLGKYLFDILQGKVQVVGVAKNPYRNVDELCQIFRGSSKKPLYVTASGLPLEQAKKYIRLMYGNHRLPVLLKRVDHICRGIRIK